MAVEIGRIDAIRNLRDQIAKAPEYESFNSITTSLHTHLVNCPQQTDKGISWLLTGGLAVSLITGTQRPHRDIDIVTLRSQHSSKLADGFHIDAVTPDQYWNGMSLSTEFLEMNAYTAYFPNRSDMIKTVHPGILLVQKLFDDSRQKGIHDLRELIAYWRNTQESWNNIITESINAYPKNLQDHARLKLIQATPTTE